MSLLRLHRVVPGLERHHVDTNKRRPSPLCLPVGLLVCIFILLLNTITMRSIFSPVGAALLSAAVQTTFAVDPTVQLNYTSYKGTSMDDGVTRWMGMRFAAPPIGTFRFREPMDPMHQTGPIDADVAGKYCLGTDGGPPSEKMDEDCLFLNVFAPSEATKDSKLPVYFFIQGGGFNTNGPPDNGSGLILAGDNDLVVVNINYRVGPYGKLHSTRSDMHWTLIEMCRLPGW